MINSFFSFFKGFGFSADEFQLITSKIQSREYKKNDIILRSDTSCDNMYFISNGLVRGFHTNDEGVEKTLWVHTSGRFITDYKAFLTRQNSSIKMDALQDSSLLFLSWHDMQFLFKAVPEFNTFCRIITEQYFIKLIDEIKMLQTYPSPLERYQVFTQLHAGIAEQIPQHMVADIINVTPVHLSRLKSTFAKKSMLKKAV